MKGYNMPGFLIIILIFLLVAKKEIKQIYNDFKEQGISIIKKDNKELRDKFSSFLIGFSIILFCAENSYGEKIFIVPSIIFIGIGFYLTTHKLNFWIVFLNIIACILLFWL